MVKLYKKTNEDIVSEYNLKNPKPRRGAFKLSLFILCYIALNILIIGVMLYNKIDKDKANYKSDNVIEQTGSALECYKLNSNTVEINELVECDVIDVKSSTLFDEINLNLNELAIREDYYDVIVSDYPFYSTGINYYELKGLSPSGLIFKPKELMKPTLYAMSIVSNKGNNGYLYKVTYSFAEGKPLRADIWKTFGDVYGDDAPVELRPQKKEAEPGYRGASIEFVYRFKKRLNMEVMFNSSDGSPGLSINFGTKSINFGDADEKSVVYSVAGRESEAICWPLDEKLEKNIKYTARVVIGEKKMNVVVLNENATICDHDFDFVYKDGDGNITISNWFGSSVNLWGIQILIDGIQKYE